MDETTIRKMRGPAKSDLTRIINSFSEHLRKSELLSRTERLDHIFKAFDHYDALLPEEQLEFEEKYFDMKAKHLIAVDTLNSSSILNDSSKTSENCIINELSQRESKLIHLPCNTVQGQSISFPLTAKGHDCATLDGSQIRRPAKRRHPNLALDSSKNSRSAEPARISSPKRALFDQNPRVIGQSYLHETTDIPVQQNFSEETSASGCLLSSSGASASRGNTFIGDSSF
ncbi:hypothetical protein NPIL_171251 [Nephila pilipes]|uniref:Uncharacterized protein n=1 Tax=Nephila pilipes TaxID=299642 RepID=A0A8X6Q8H3_NEPPI|nr:hypothetical protein NPIL_171251 [Nephila pilipes]